MMYTVMGCCKTAGVNVYGYLTYFLDHVHEYDYAPERDLAELLPGSLKAILTYTPIFIPMDLQVKHLILSLQINT